MEITKQKIWMLLQILAAAYLIISSCMDPPKPFTSGEVPRINYGKSLTRFQQPVFNPFIKTVSFNKVSGHLEWPDTYHNNLFFINP